MNSSAGAPRCRPEALQAEAHRFVRGMSKDGQNRAWVETVAVANQWIKNLRQQNSADKLNPQDSGSREGRHGAEKI